MKNQNSIYETNDGKVIVSRMNSGLVSIVFNEVVAKTMEASNNDNEMIFESVIK